MIFFKSTCCSVVKEAYNTPKALNVYTKGEKNEDAAGNNSNENLKKPVCLYEFVLKSRRFARSFYRKWSFCEAFLKVGFTKYQFLHGPVALRSSPRGDI